MSEPTTEAGRSLMLDWFNMPEAWTADWLAARLAAIEAEARRPALDVVRDDIERALQAFIEVDVYQHGTWAGAARDMARILRAALDAAQEDGT